MLEVILAHKGPTTDSTQVQGTASFKPDLMHKLSVASYMCSLPRWQAQSLKMYIRL